MKKRKKKREEEKEKEKRNLWVRCDGSLAASQLGQPTDCQILHSHPDLQWTSFFSPLFTARGQGKPQSCQREEGDVVLNLGEVSLPFVTSQDDQWPELDVWKTEKWNKLIRNADKLE